FGETLRGLAHVLQSVRVGQQIAKRGIEELGDAGCVGATRGEHAAEQFGEAVALRDRGRDHGAGSIETLRPAEAARRAFYAEKGRNFVLRREHSQRSCHSNTSTLTWRPILS